MAPVLRLLSRWTQFALAFTVAATLVGCLGPLVPGSAAEREPTTAEYDAEAAADFAKGQEARQWIARQDTTFFEIPKEMGTKITEDFYNAGATKVVVSDGEKLTEDSQVEIGSTFIVELPSDPEKRKKCFEIERVLYDEEEMTKDEGQKYIVVTTD